MMPTGANLGKLVAARLVAANLVAANLVAASLVAANLVAARGLEPAKVSQNQTKPGVLLRDLSPVAPISTMAAAGKQI